MRVVVQRVSSAAVRVDGEIISEMGRGLCVLLGINKNDTEASIEPVVKKLLSMKLFEDTETNQPWKHSVSSLNLDLMIISQFTLDAYFKGAKPDFHNAMGGDQAKAIFDKILARAAELHPKKLEGVKTGKFGADMKVSLTNDGPVTIIWDHPKKDDKSKN